MIWTAVKGAARDFVADDCPRMAAALSYYTVFSLPPVMILVLLVSGLFVSTATAETHLQQQMAGLLGERGAEAIGGMLEHARLHGDRSTMSWILGSAALLFGATGAFFQLQGALNKAWNVEPEAGGGVRSGVKNFLVKRLVSFGMVLTFAFLLLTALLLSSVISATGGVVGGFFPAIFSAAAIRVLNVVTTILLVTVLFGLVFVVLPDAHVPLRLVWVGAFTTACLFVAGKFIIGFYIARMEPGSTFGAAGSLAVILLWVYFSALIFFYGAELTQWWCRLRGQEIRREDRAERREEAATEPG